MGKLLMIMDPVEQINPEKDSSLAILLAAQKRGWELYYTQVPDLWVEEAHGEALVQQIEVHDRKENWVGFSEPFETVLDDFSLIFMRKDPPFDMNYIYATHILDLAQKYGSMVINKPGSLRDCNEKMFINWFPECIAPTLVTQDRDCIDRFVQEQGPCVIKPLDGMGGQGIFGLSQEDLNYSSLIETSTDQGKNMVMIQKYLPEITQGDKRILLIDGEPVPYSLARIPKSGEFRGNIAAGGKIKGQKLSERDLWLCKQIGPELRKRGLYFVGLDVIGDFVTEINVTSPTCIRELDREFKLDIAGDLMACLEKKLDEQED